MEEQKKEPLRPICLELEDAKAEIFAVVNMANKKRGIPFFLLESIVNEAARQVADFARQERETANRNYEQELLEYEKQRGERDDK